MLGAIAGDIIGSPYEHRPIKTLDFPLFGPDSRFTDDTVLTVACAFALLRRVDYSRAYQDFGRRYPRAGYGASFQGWIFQDNPQPYNSWGNGSAMRVSPVGFMATSKEQVLEEAERSARVTHDHPEGIKGAQATALAIFMARRGEDKGAIGSELTRRFGYDLERSLAEIRPGYRFDVSCQGSVPEAIIAFLEAKDYEQAVRNAVSLGGDADTQACIAGGIAQAFFGLPEEIARQARQGLDDFLGELVDEFSDTFGL
ncbi:MAG: ADP-ribosylglycohydrolase family protein [Candidatus Competibacteraceae bacterium]|nr:ADP-ribosylglycohydrolase family protein [Candidatus Competibacteraceae bacterium]